MVFISDWSHFTLSQVRLKACSKCLTISSWKRHFVREEFSVVKVEITANLQKKLNVKFEWHAFDKVVIFACNFTGECQWLHLELIKEMQTFCKTLFPVVDYAYCTIPTYPSGQIGFMLCSKNPVRFFLLAFNNAAFVWIDLQFLLLIYTCLCLYTLQFKSL